MHVRSVLALCLLAAPAAADITHRHGSTCAPKHSSRDLVGADERGTYNASSTATANVTCAAIDRVQHRRVTINRNHYRDFETEAALLENLRVYGRDTSATSPFSCYVFWTAEDGFSSWGPTKYTCSQPGGCPDRTTDYIGNTSLEFAIDTFDITGTDHLGVVCNLPPASGSYGSSYVKSLRTFDAAIAVRTEGDTTTSTTTWTYAVSYDFPTSAW